jgi:F-type H+-transporting ATPase subunit a
MRLFTNMVAGHVMMKVLASFVAILGPVNGGFLPLALMIAVTALELLVAFLQAYVFTAMTCLYLKDALHPSH